MEMKLSLKVDTKSRIPNLAAPEIEIALSVAGPVAAGALLKGKTVAVDIRVGHHLIHERHGTLRQLK
jgi:hypothetical protein